jgi:hypothetical protein
VKTWIATRWRVLVASAAVVALVAGVGVWAVVQLDPSRNDAVVDCSSLEATTFADANALSQACDDDVEVLAERTPWQTSYATADNAARLVVTTVPSRVLVDGEWTDLDPKLVVDEKAGTIEVVAAVSPIAINAGGDAGRGKPLGSITTDDHQLSVWFPLDLPVPEVSDTHAVYQLGDGIRLLVSVNVDATGFLPVVELADADAAARFAQLLDTARPAKGAVSKGLGIEFATELSDGLTMTVDEAGAISALDEAGDTQFVATAPLMWDSAGGDQTLSPETTEVGITDRTRSPAEGDQIAAMGVTLATSTIVVSPDKAMLKNSETVWPVYLDPGFGTQSPSKWVAVRKGGYTGTLVNWGDISSSMLGQGTGYCTASSCNTVFYQRLAWQFSGLSGLASLAGSDVTAATFNVDGQHSYNCTAQTTTLYRTSDIGGFGTGANWNNLGWLQGLGSRAEAHSNSCGNKGFRGFNALGAAQWAADNNSSVLNLGLAVGEANMTPWKRFRHNANLVIDYNREPNIPTNAQFTSPPVNSCVTGAGRPVIATTTPTIAVNSSDPDGGNVQTTFNVAMQNNLTTLKWDSGYQAAVTSGLQRAVAVPGSAGLVDGGVYAWRARAFDGARYSAAWSSWCEFGVDISAPVAPTVTPVASGVPAVYLKDVPGGGVNLAGKFTLDRGTSTDVVSFTYGFNAPSNPSVATADGTGKAIIDFPAPTTTGTVTLTVKSKDAAGNMSPTRSYSFVVASATEDGIWTLDEGSGSTAADTAGNPARPLTISGANWVDGPHALFDSREGDKALSFNGTDQLASTTAQVVDTRESFVVSAQVKLDTVHGTGPFTALSQDGVTQSGFQLGYTPAANCPGGTTDCWSFSMPDAESGSSTAVFSTVPVTEGEWTYLVGEHNKDTHTIRLWVCEIGTPDDPAIGETVRSEATRSGTAWAAAGFFALGRAQTAGAASNWWPGAIDNVRVFSGEVLAESKIRRMCQGAEATDFGGNDDELDPSVED